MFWSVLPLGPTLVQKHLNKVSVQSVELLLRDLEAFSSPEDDILVILVIPGLFISCHYEIEICV